MIKHSILLFFLLFILPVQSQQPQLSEQATISVITCGAGTELYSSFGHSAFRVQDSEKGIDWIYNYGTFDFNTPNFYIKFARGKLLYSLSKQRFENFLYAYELENRWVKEQVLDVTQDQKNAIFSFLERNYLPENRDYKYDFLFENCSTKIPEVLQKALENELSFENYLDHSDLSFRDLIHQNLHYNSWAAFGIDLALGAVIDRDAEYEEYMFLPNYVLTQLNHTKIQKKPIVLRERTILDHHSLNRANFFTNSPLFWFGLLFILTVTITYIDFKNHVRSKVLDIGLFGITGITGLLITFLWFLTDHQATAMNLNILWAFPGNLVFLYFLITKVKKPQWFKGYVLGLLIGIGITGLIWIFGVQVFSPILCIVLATLAVRYAFLVYRLIKFHPSEL